jgi:hypothetical protein
MEGRVSFIYIPKKNKEIMGFLSFLKSIFGKGEKKEGTPVIETIAVGPTDEVEMQKEAIWFPEEQLPVETPIEAPVVEDRVVEAPVVEEVTPVQVTVEVPTKVEEPTPVVEVKEEPRKTAKEIKAKIKKSEPKPTMKPVKKEQPKSQPKANNPNPNQKKQPKKGE